MKRPHCAKGDSKWLQQHLALRSVSAAQLEGSMELGWPHGAFKHWTRLPDECSVTKSNIPFISNS